MATLATHLNTRGEEKRDEEEQLLQLFRNRAQLKQELNKLRDESLRLQEAFEEQEARTLRAQQRLEQLEATLGDPDSAMTAVAFYRLRSIWEYCHSRLDLLSQELERAQHDKAHRHHVAGFQRRISEALEKVTEELKLVTAQGEVLSAKIDALDARLRGRMGLWNFFRRRKLKAEKESYEQERRAIHIRIGELTEKLHTGRGEEPPEFAGLDVRSRRRINLTVIAYAQELFVHFADRELAGLIKEASIQKLADASYGSQRDCRLLAKYADDRMKLLQADTKLRDRVRFRTERLQETVQYRHEKESVPDASTLGLIVLYKPNGKERGEIAVNVLGDEYWDVFSTLVD